MTFNKALENERQVVQAVKVWYNAHTYGPSFRDIVKMTNISLGTVYTVCKELREAGILEFEDGVARTIKLKEKK
jgi:transposase